MKTKLSRVGKSSLSMILSLMMIFSTMLIGTITTANAAISYWTVTAGFNKWNIDDSNYRIDGSTGSVTYDTNNIKEIIYFRMVAHGDEGVIQNSLENGKTVSISSDSRQKLVWGISDTSKSISFTPTKRYVKFSIDSEDNNNYLTVTESDSDSASGGGATIGAAPAEVLNRTNVMFYVKADTGGDEGKIYLTDNDNSHPKKDVSVINKPYGYISVPRSDLDTYYYISNSSGWQGNKSEGIKSAKGGELFTTDSSVGTVPATTANTTLSSREIVKSSANLVTLTTTASSDKAAYTEKSLYIQYYVDDKLVATESNISASTSAQDYTLDISSYFNGKHTLKTVLTDGKVYYIADTDTFTILSEGQSVLKTPEIQVSNGGVITSGGSVTVSVSNNDYPADAGVTFELYKDGTKTSQSGTGPFTVSEPGSYTVKAVSNNDKYIESDPSSPVTVAVQEVSTFQLCEGSEFKQLGSFTKLGNNYSITLNFTKGIHRLSVYDTSNDGQHYLNSNNAVKLQAEGDVFILYKYGSYTENNNNDLADFIARRDGEYTFKFTKRNTNADDNAWNLTLVKAPEAPKYTVTSKIDDVANLRSMTITDSSDVEKTEFAADSVVKVKITASDEAYKPGGLKLKKDDGSDASVNVSSNGDGVFSFYMPEYNVTVTPVITQKANYDVTLNYDSKIGTVTSSSHEITADNKIEQVREGTIVTLDATGIGGYNFAGWGISGATLTEGTVNSKTIKIRVDSTTIVKAMFTDNAFTVVDSNAKFLSAMSKVEENVYVSSIPVANDVTFTVRSKDGKYIISTADDGKSFWLNEKNYSDAYSLNVNSFGDSIVKPYYNISGSSRYVVYDANKKSVYLADDPSLRLTYSVYAKNGTIATNGTQDYGVTKVTSGVIDTKGLENVGYTKYMAVEGSIITVQTTVNSTYKKDGYYVYAYCVNGKTVPAQQTEPGVYSASYTIDGTNTDIEITPVYFNTKIEEAGDYITFYVNADELKGKWGDTVALYTYYYKSGDVNNKNAYSASAYPGQPMLQNKDELFYIKVPKYYYDKGQKQYGYNKDAKKPYAVSGMTINNYGLESLHKTLKGAKGADGKVANNQSYDYKDFAVLAEQGYDTIMFDVKYRKGTSNQSSLLDNEKYAPDKTGTTINISTYGDKTHNGWDDFKNYFSGKETDVLGYDLNPTQTNELYVVSTGNQQTTVGVWSTEWYVFNQKGEFIVQGNPNDFILTDEDVAEDSTNKIWLALKDYKGAKTQICYESEMDATTSIDGYNSGIRVDGRWYYTKADDVKVTLKTSVEYSQDHGTNFTEDKNINPKNTGFVGEVTGVKAAINDATSYEFPLNATDAVLTASSSSLWLFKGWYVKDAQGNYIEYDKDAMSEIELVTGAYTEFVARYIKIGSGQLVLSHTAYDGPDKLGGRGTYYIQVDLTDTDGKTTTYDYTTGSITIPIVQSDQSISIKLKTVCAGNNTFYRFYEKDKDGKYLPFGDEDGSYVGMTGTIDYPSFTVKPSDLFDSSGKQITMALNYYSDISPVTGDAVLKYRYKNRFDQDRVYTVKVKLDDNYYDKDKNAYIINSANPDHQKLIMDNAPAIDDLHKDCLWSITQQTTTINGTNVVLDGIQTGKKFTVNLKYYEDNETVFAPEHIDKLALNSYIKNSDTGDFYKTAAEVNGEKFLYWTVVSADTKREIARCYSQYFNLRVTDNFIVTPVYGGTSEPYISIGNATYTREQYTEAGINYDYLYADFIVAFMSPDAELLNQSSKYKTGVIVELNQNAKVTKDNVKNGGTFGAVGSTVDYSGIEFKSTSDKIQELATGDSSRLTYTNAENVSNIAYKFEINNQGYNNKNRLDYYVKFKNTQAYRNYVMKAYYYVYEVDESGNAREGTCKITNEVYFNLYDIGNSETKK